MDAVWKNTLPARSLLLRLALAAAFFTGARSASATTVLPALFDARSVGMGGTGVAWAHDGTAAFHNPAGLGAIDRFAISVAVSPFLPKSSAPIAGPGTETESARGLVPVLFLGGGVRLLDQLAIGLAAFAASGFGARYEGVAPAGGRDLSVEVGTFELAAPIAFTPFEGLSFGIAPRAAYTRRKIELVIVDPSSMALLPFTQELSGFTFLGISAGLHYRPLAHLEIGASYQSKMTVGASGTTTFGGPDLDSTARDPASPHAFKIGLALQVLERLSLALALDPLALRAGYAVGNSATPRETADPFVLAPGVEHSLHAGAGVRWTHASLDLAFAYLFTGETIESGPNGGEYRGRGLLFSTSFTYRR